MSEETKAVVMAYFNSWQGPADFGAFRRSLADNVEFDAGSGKINGAERLVSMVEGTESPRESVTLLASIFAGDAAALFYEGIDKRSKIKTRVAEHLIVADGRITRILAAICPLTGEEP